VANLINHIEKNLKAQKSSVHLDTLFRGLREINPSLSKNEVLSQLLAMKKEGVVQSSGNNFYEWVKQESNDSSKTEDVDALSSSSRWTKFRKLLRYYIRAIEQESKGGVSVYLEDEGRSWIPYEGQRRWIPDKGKEHTLNFRPFMTDFNQSLLNKAGSLRVVYGYPVLYNSIISKRTGEPVSWLEPLILWDVEHEIKGKRLVLRPQPGRKPRCNEKWLNHRLQQNGRDELYSLLERIPKLELSETLIETVISLVAPRLHRQDMSTPFSSLLPVDLSETDGGLYNSGIITVIPDKTFTQGMLTELRYIKKNATDEQLEKSALKHFFFPERQDDADECEEADGIYMVRSLNPEQESAVRLGASKSVTMVLGPPGTGKTDVATSIACHQTIAGKSVLIASKNNVAVDEVFDRLCEIQNNLPQEASMRREYSFFYRLGQGHTQNFQEVLKQILPTVLASPSKTASKRASLLCKSEFTKKKYLRDIIAETDLLSEELMNHFEDIACLEGDADTDRDWSLSVSVDEISLILKNLSSHYKWSINLDNLMFVGKLLNWLYLKVSDSKYEDIRKQLQSQLCLERCDSDKLLCERSSKNLELLKHLLEIQRIEKRLAQLPSISDVWKEDKVLSEEIVEKSKPKLSNWLKDRINLLTPESHRDLSDLRTIIGIRTQTGLSKSMRRGVKEKLNKVATHLGTLVPVWLCTNLSLRKRLPLSPGIFDLALVDESSACDIPSIIPILYRSKRAIIIGDNNQLSHVTRLSDEIENRITSAEGIDDLEFLDYRYTAVSAYDLAEKTVAGNPKVCGAQKLLLHYRCHDDIINFCSEQFYDGELQVLTATERLRVPKNKSPGIIWSHVSGSFEKQASGCLCDEEARACAEEVVALTTRNRFNGTIGVVTVFKSQEKRISQYLEQMLDSKTMTDYAIVVGTAHKFQGGQRDAIVMSLMYSHDMPKGSKYFLESNRNLMNVAISRAASVLHVVGNLEQAKDSTIPHISGFAKYYLRLEEKRKSPIQTPEPSLWETRFKESLSKAGIETVAQYPVDGKFLDLAYIEKGIKIDIEVDGERWHLDEQGRRNLSDHARDLRLEAHGWTVLRFWVFQIRDRPNECIEKIQQEILKQRNSTNV
jgi:very-short-patch-repair endonuclease